MTGSVELFGRATCTSHSIGLGAALTVFKAPPSRGYAARVMAVLIPESNLLSRPSGESAPKDSHTPSTVREIRGQCSQRMRAFGRTCNPAPTALNCISSGTAAIIEEDQHAFTLPAASAASNHDRDTALLA